MDDNFLSDGDDHSVVEIPIAPILDMMVAVIFFLLISASFFNFSSQTLPPAKNVMVNDPKALQPSTPKLIIDLNNNELELTLSWVGQKSGQKITKIPISDPKVYLQQIETTVYAQVSAFLQNYPKETSLQLGLAPDLPNQVLISSMDGITRAHLDIVLISYDVVLKNKSGNGG